MNIDIRFTPIQKYKDGIIGKTVTGKYLFVAKDYRSRTHTTIKELVNTVEEEYGKQTERNTEAQKEPIRKFPGVVTETPKQKRPRRKKKA
jgi:hypothetical protein